MGGFSLLGDKMWSFGYSDYISGEDTIDVFWGESASFVDALSELYDNVEKEANDAEEYEMAHYVQVLADISDIKNDPSFSEDPDQWEDMEFTDDIGEIIYYVMET